MSRQSSYRSYRVQQYGLTPISPADYPEYVHSFPTSGPQSEMFEFPGFAANLFSIAQACQLPPEYMTYVIQIAELEQWKSAQDNSGTLSYRELARRGKAIERMLLGQGVTGSTRYANPFGADFMADSPATVTLLLLTT
jgi:hypothetical protein